ncbi:MAG: hypothetical protein GXZ11_05880 [Tissierellia bacterium]|nr:hypothetical protein [Tissierellia bacterium]
MKGLGQGNYKIVYKASEDQYESDNYKPASLKFTFAGNDYVIGTDTDGNIPIVPKNERTDCAVDVNKSVSKSVDDYINKDKYKELDFRRQDFIFDSSFNLTSEVLEAKTSIILKDKLDDKLDILDAYIVDGDDIVNGTLVAELKGVEYGDNDHEGVPELTLTNNEISYSLPENPKDIGGTSYKFGNYVGKKFVLVVKLKLKDSVSDEDIQEMRTTLDQVDGKPMGVTNKSNIQLDNKPLVESNVARAVPPAFIPPTTKKEIAKKAVEGQEDIWYSEFLELEKRDDIYRYRIGTAMPKDTTGYEKLVINDKLDQTLNIENLDNLSIY